MPVPGSFDQAAIDFDAVRGFPPRVGQQVAEAARVLLAGRERVLEVGVGTGRIARGLLERGVPVWGLDVSRSMLQRLLAALPEGVGRPVLVQGQAEHLPVAAASLDALLAVHVFHLIPDWPAAVAEVRRVLRPGGLFLNGYEWRPAEAPGARLMAQWRHIVQARTGGAVGAAGVPGTHDFADIRAALLDGGAHCQEARVGEWTTTRSLARSLEAIEHRTWAPTWNQPAGFFAACLDELRAWAVAEYGPLAREYETPHRFVWEAYAWAR